MINPCYYSIMEDINRFGENLREIRKQKGYTQNQLAKVAGVSRRIISHYETLAKCPSAEKMTKIANALNVSINELMGTGKKSLKRSRIEDVSHKIMKKVRIIEELPVRDQNAIFHYINALVEKNKSKKK